MPANPTNNMTPRRAHQESAGQHHDQIRLRGIGSGLRDARRDRGWTQEEAADQLARLAWVRRSERVGVNADMIAKWERGEKNPSTRYRELLCLLYEGPLPSTSA